MDYGYPTSEGATIDPALLKVLNAMQRSIEEAIERLAKIEQQIGIKN
ncbi:MAG: hypothetical protein JSV21_07420 [Nitrospirota bacterium]|nr:MAG: hypothetical protein JSV21_07420 [Nitrospirota bacterium]